MNSPSHSSGGSPAPPGWQPPSPETLQAFLPGFVVQKFLARGGMGAVYRGEQECLERPVAIKILPPELLRADPLYAQRFKHEARSMGQLNHPGIVSVYDFGEMPDGTLYFIMEFIDGTDVGQMLARQARLPSAHAMAITAHVCDALQYAHDHGVVHRDIKPANIMVGYDGSVKVADFGLAKSEHQQDLSLTVSGHVMGTPHFVAPEALTLGVSVDHRADIYAVGVMFYQMLTGRLPQGMFELPSRQVAGLDPRYDAIVTSAMRDDRELRYQSIREMRRALDSVVTQPLKVEAPQPQPRPGQTVVTKRTHQSGSQALVVASPQARTTLVSARLPQQRPRPQPQPKKSSIGGWLAVLVVLGLAAVGYHRHALVQGDQRRNVQIIEGEDLVTLSVTGGKPDARYDVGQFTGANWSGGGYLWWINATKGDELRLKLPVARSGRQRLKILFPMAADAGIVAGTLDGRPLPGSPFDFEAPDITLAGTTDCGVWDLQAGDHELAFELLGTHGRKLAFGDTVMGIDCIRLEPAVMEVEKAGRGSDIAPRAKASASFCSHDFNVSAINDGREPSRLGSSDQAAPHQTWFPRRSSLEWVQYEWDAPQVLDECQVYWFDDTRVNGGCQLPVFWRICYREDSGAWVPVDATVPAATIDEWNNVKFPSVKTTALRIIVQCKEARSAGMCHWKVLAAEPASMAGSGPAHRPDLSLSDLPPLRYQTNWLRYHVNQVQGSEAKIGRTVQVDGKPCEKFLWAHANSRLEFAIPSGYTRFKVLGSALTPDFSAGTWKHIVQVDGVTVFESRELRSYPDKKAPVDVVLPPGARRLTLITDNCGSGYGDWAFWANPLLLADQ